MSKAYRRDPDNPRSQFVAHVVLCKGVPFYGFHVGYHYFLKIYLLSPYYLNKFADLLRNGAIGGRVIQPFEAHIPYLLQFFTDFNLAGTGSMKLDHAMFREPLPADGDGFSQKTVSEQSVLDSRQFKRMSHCELEIDIDASAIQNRYKLKQRDMHHDFSEWTSQLTSQDGSRSLFIPSLTGIWMSEANRRHMEGDSSFQPPVEATQRAVSKDPPWRRLEELRQALSVLLEKDDKKFNKDFNESDNIPTIFDTVDTMFRRRRKMPTPEAVSEQDDIAHQSSIEKQEDYLDDLFSDPEEEDPEVPSKQAADEVPPNDLSPDSDADSAMSKTDQDEQAQEDPLSQSLNKNEDKEDPLSQMLKDVDFSEPMELVATKTDPFASLTDSMILDEVGIQESFLAVVKNNAEAKEFILSQGTPEKRMLSQGSPTPDKRVLSFASPQDSPVTRKTKQRLLEEPRRRSFWGESMMDLDTFSDQPIVSPFNNSSRPDTGDLIQRQFVKKVVNGCRFENSVYVARLRPPKATEVMNSFESLGLPRIPYKDPYFSNPKDVPIKPAVFAGIEFKLRSDALQHLPLFSFTNQMEFLECTENLMIEPMGYKKQQLRYGKRPPSVKTVQKWCQSQQSKRKRLLPQASSQIRGPTQKATYDFKYATQKKLASHKSENSKYLSSLFIELHVNTRDELYPDSNIDEIAALFWAFQSPNSDEWDNDKELVCGSIFVCSPDEPMEAAHKKYQSACKFSIEMAEDELELINLLTEVVREYDPDILGGFEVNSSSWGYVIDRGKKGHDIDLCNILSRVKDQGHGAVGDKWGNTHTSSIAVTGRHVLNVWRILRNEVNLLKYSLENIVYHTLHHRIPLYTHKTLTDWYKSPSVSNCGLTVRYYFDRVIYTIKLINSQELISRTSEQARIVGIDFYSVFYRGSQYKVEAIMSRLTKAENYVMISPSRKQVGEQNALECLPLIMEPESKLYTSPVVVLDFQSLYPSIMIAYNYCYSTCLGRLQNWRGKNKLGFINYEKPDGLLKKFENEINIAPNGIIYVKQQVRESLLAKMLAEILDTRVMVKDGMKSKKDNSSFQKLMNNRQLALKLIANVTYGYTSASFSGRMPCVEIADSIVQSARETLEKAIDTIKSNPKWGAEVVYGDTDSLFLHFSGKSKDQAFDIGNEIAEAVTNMNPQPVKLKFEKVYLPCVLQTKKRYVGHAFMYKGQKEPKFDAKGMETVRRDGTPAQQKMEERALDILFRTVDLSKVKSYFEQEWTKIMRGKISVQDFCFAKEVKLGSYRGLPPPGAMIATEKLKLDPNSGPQYRERVPYVVIAGAPGERLVDRCVAPDVLVNNSAITLDSEYYITKNLIPPLERIFNLVGANIRLWYDEMPKVTKSSNLFARSKALGMKKQHMNLRHYMKDSHCRVCLLPKEGNLASEGICNDCWEKPFESIYTLTKRARKREKNLNQLNAICRNCAGLAPASTVPCISLDCPIYYSKKRAAVFYEDAVNDMKVSESMTW